MADVAPSAGLIAQIRLVAGLRWRLLRNSMRKKNNRLDLIGLIFAGIFGGILVIGLCFAFYAGAYQFLSNNRPGWIALLFWGIFLFWQSIPLFVAGFGANFEFRTLLRFPMSLSAFYIIGLAYGLADFSAMASLCWLLSMTAGATVAKPGVLPAMLLIGAAFVLFNVTLERLVGSWLERLLSRRRTRELFLGLFVLSMISLNFITPLLNRYGAAARPSFLRLLPYFAWLPPSLAGRAIASAAQLQPAGFLLGSAGLLLYVLALTLLLRRRFSAQYRGEELSETAAPVRPAVRPIAAKDDGPDRLGLLSPQVAAVLRKEFRYLTRNGFTFLTLLLPPMLVFIFSMNFTGGHPTWGKGVSADFFFSVPPCFRCLAWAPADGLAFVPAELWVERLPSASAEPCLCTLASAPAELRAIAAEASSSGSTCKRRIIGQRTPFHLTCLRRLRLAAVPPCGSEGLAVCVRAMLLWLFWRAM